ncbi:tetratricopeptide repeat protein [Novilysobacter selenitireducens]|uniref:tetratricopeptide repeat protein n=1 Tax=Novilysobacter selenitireducens TaxID=2872639 RepID=UPI001CBD9C05|nr:tetratricopeptide repeat protein [Lysobacter selenitireducens]
MSDHATTIDALRRGAVPEALAAAREAVAAQPDDATAQRLLAAALRLSGEREAALEAIDRAIDLAPDDANLHLERAGLMLHERKLDEAQTSLARSVGLDPNQFPAYIIQGHLALGRGDLDEAERLVRTAARIAPEHPQVAALEGTLAVRRGDADRGLALLATAAERHPEDTQVRHALAFAYLAKGHLAFAEQAFRQLLEKQPQSRAMRFMIAELLRRQGRPGEAADELAPLLADGTATPGLKRMVGQVELQAGRPERGLPLLKEALAARPDDRATIVALVDAWRRAPDSADDARNTLDAALSTHPGLDALWRARLVFEPFAGDTARAVVERWQAAMPDHVPALEAMSTIHRQAGELDAAEAIARRIVVLRPGHTQAELRIVDSHINRGDHDGAIARVHALLEQAQDEASRASLRQLLARVHDLAGRHAEAAALWTALQADQAPRLLPLPEHSASLVELPDRTSAPEDAASVLFLWGAPGSMVERLGHTLALARAPLQPDRFSGNPPRDAFQRIDTARRLQDGSLSPADAAQSWRDALAARRLTGAHVMDWLLWWDNSLLPVLRAHLPEAELMIALRDPRDMLLDWLAWGSPAPFAMPSPKAAAEWLATSMGQVADLHEQDLVRHHLVRMDGITEDPAAIARAMGEALQTQVPDAGVGALGPARFPAGHWRAYAEPLAEAFALLTPVAQRLGYPEA